MSHSSKPHVSPALRHLRLSVTILAVALGGAYALQMLVWGFIYYTDVRWTEIEVEREPTPLTVVETPSESVEQDAPTPAPTASAEKELDPTKPIADEAVASGGGAQGVRSLTGRGAATRSARTQQAVVEKEVNRVFSRNDIYFRRITAFAQTVGVIAAIALAIVMLEGVVIAGGASVPGVERAVTAATWCLVIALLSIPLQDIIPAFPYPGVFAPYPVMTEAADLAAAGGEAAPSSFALLLRHVLLPLSLLGALVLVALRFHAGVEQGSLATNVSELDEKLEREMAKIKLVSTGSSRAMGALNRAIGDDSPPTTAAMRRAEAQEKKANAQERGRGFRDPSPGEPLSRPI